MDDPLRAGSGGRPLPPRTVLRLQQTLGNREVARLLAVSPPSTTCASATPQALCAPAVVPRVPLRARLAIAWGWMTGDKAEKD